MDQQEVEMQADSPESKRLVATIVGGWLLALMVLPGGGLLWQWGTVQHAGRWLVGTVLAELHLAGLVI